MQEMLFVHCYYFLHYKKENDSNQIQYLKSGPCGSNKKLVVFLLGQADV